jgi:hypothetical protein
MAVETNYQVLYVDGDIPTTPIRLGQLVMDGTVLKRCTALSPLTYTAITAGGGSPPGGSNFQLQFNDAGAFNGFSNGTAGQILTSNGAGSAPSFQTLVGGGGKYVRGATFVSSAPLVAGAQTVPLYFPTAATILSATVLTQGGTGTCQVDVRKGTFAAYPTVTTICGGNEPAVTAGTKSTDTTLTGWTTAVSAGDVLVFVLESTSTFTTIVVQLEFQS